MCAEFQNFLRWLDGVFFCADHSFSIAYLDFLLSIYLNTHDTHLLGKDWSFHFSCIFCDRSVLGNDTLLGVVLLVRPPSAWMRNFGKSLLVTERVSQCTHFSQVWLTSVRGFLNGASLLIFRVKFGKKSKFVYFTPNWEIEDLMPISTLLIHKKNYYTLLVWLFWRIDGFRFFPVPSYNNRNLRCFCNKRAENLMTSLILKIWDKISQE